MLLQRLLLGLVATGFVAHSSVADVGNLAANCKELHQRLIQINDQAPVRLDHMTELMGITVLYLSGECRVTYKLIVDESRMVDTLVKALEAQAPSPENPAIARKIFYSDRFSEFLMANIKDNISAFPGMMPNAPGLKLALLYAFSEGRTPIRLALNP